MRFCSIADQILVETAPKLLIELLARVEQPRLCEGATKYATESMVEH